MANVFTRTNDNGGGWEISNAEGNGTITIDSNGNVIIKSNGNVSLNCTSLKANNDTVIL